MITMTKIIYKILLTILLSSNFIFAQNISIKFFPEKKFYEKHFADAIAQQFSITKNFETPQWFGNVGVELTLTELSIMENKFQLSVGSTVFNTLIKTPGHIQVYTADYLVDFYLDKPLTNDLIGRFIWGHLSAHYADDGILELNNYSISYVRDYAGLSLQNKINAIDGKVYGSLYYNFHNEPMLDKKITCALGLDAGKEIFKDVLLYGAIDLKFKSEVNYGTTQSYQAGFRFPFGGNKNFRLAYTHRRGFEERGQLFNIKSIKNNLGIYFDF